jgi:microcompartment protein CcmL/EutN
LEGKALIKTCVGFIETAGLAAAIAAADTAVKSANIKIIGYEFARGDGMSTVKIEGDVSAVKMALLSASAVASTVGKVVSVDVIPRPAAGLEALVYTKDTVGLKSDKVAPKQKATPKPKAEESEAAQNSQALAGEEKKHSPRGKKGNI